MAEPDQPYSRLDRITKSVAEVFLAHMKSSVIPESFLKCMLPADRKRLGQMSTAEAIVAFSDRSEKELQRQIYAELNRRGLFFVWQRMDRRTTSTVGTPDFVLPLNGQYVAIEAKTATGTLSAAQERVRERVIAQGGKYYVVRSFDEFLEILK